MSIKTKQLYDLLSEKEKKQFKTNYNLIKNSGKFDVNYYLSNYDDVRESKVDPIEHYLLEGYKKDYNPNKTFFSKYYLEYHDDVNVAGMNPLVHYIKFGEKEGRILPRKYSKKESEKIKKELLKKHMENVVLHQFDENAPLISIIILNKNGLNYLKILFDNFNKTICYPNYEIIIVDNGSTDNSLKYLQSLSHDLPIKIIKNNYNQSFSEANNQGVLHAKGEYIVLLNNDIEPIYGWLNILMKIMLSSTNIGVVGSKLLFPYDENNFLSYKVQCEGINFKETNSLVDPNDGYLMPYNIKGDDFKYERECKEIVSVLGAAMLIKKSLYLKLGGLDTRFYYNYEDIDFCLKAIYNGYKVIQSKESILFHYYTGTREITDDAEDRPLDLYNRRNLHSKWGFWLREKYWLDRINNNRIYCEDPLKVMIVYDKDYPIENDYIIHNNGWDTVTSTNGITNSKINICISSNPYFNPSTLNNKGNYPDKKCINIALINNNINKWIKSGEYYDFIITKYKNIKYLFPNKNVYLSKDRYLLNNVKYILNEIHENDIDKFNLIIDNVRSIDNIKYNRIIVNFIKKSYFEDINELQEYMDADAGIYPFNGIKIALINNEEYASFLRRILSYLDFKIFNLNNKTISKVNVNSIKFKCFDMIFVENITDTMKKFIDKNKKKKTKIVELHFDNTLEKDMILKKNNLNGLLDLSIIINPNLINKNSTNLINLIYDLY